MNTIGVIVKRHLEHNNYNVSEAAKLIDETQSKLSNIINDKITLEANLSYKLDKLFNLSPGTLMRIRSQLEKREMIKKDSLLNLQFDSVKKILNANKDDIYTDGTIKNAIYDAYMTIPDRYKGYLEKHDANFNSYKDKPLALLWVALMQKKSTTVTSSGKFALSSYDKVVRESLRIMCSKNAQSTKLRLLKQFLDKNGIVLENGPFLSGSTIFGASMKHGSQRYIFLNDGRKREYSYIISLIHEIMHTYNKLKVDSNTEVVELIKSVMNKYNLSHKDLEFSLETVKTSSSEEYDKVHQNTNVKINFGSQEEFIMQRWEEFKI